MYFCRSDCPGYPGGCPWPGLPTPPHCTFEKQFDDNQPYIDDEDDFDPDDVEPNYEAAAEEKFQDNIEDGMCGVCGNYPPELLKPGQLHCDECFL